MIGVLSPHVFVPGQMGFVGIQWVIPGLAIGGVLTYLGITGRLSFETTEADRRPDEEESLETLKRRYVEGTIDQVEFERKLETLFENETVSDAKQSVADGAGAYSRNDLEPSTSSSETASNVEGDRSRRPRPRKCGHNSTRRSHCK